MKNPQDRKSFLSIFEETQKKNGHAYPPIEEEDQYEGDLSLTDELDHAILMHRDAHFGGDFEVMLTYYQDEENIGVNLDFDLDRIAYLAEVEKELGQDLSAMILTGSEAEHVARARRAYEILKDVYEEENTKNPLPRLIADLILTEEEEPEEIVDAVVGYGTRIVPELLQVIQSNDAYDPLFPGYGYAPYLAVLCLGRIKDERSIIPLFEILGREFIFDEEIIFHALFEIGKEAKNFLLKMIKGRPITDDNINAALSLTAFAQDPEVAIASLKQLQDPEVQQHSVLATYLMCNCEPLQNTEFREDLIALSKNEKVPLPLRIEIEKMTKHWK